MQHKKRILSLLCVLMIVAVPLVISGVSSVHAQGSVIFADDFEYDDSLENHGWTILTGNPHTAVDPENPSNWVAYLLSPANTVGQAFSHSFNELPLQPGMQLSIRFYDTGDSCNNCDVHTYVHFDSDSSLIEVGWYNSSSSFEYNYTVSGSSSGHLYEPYGLRGVGWHTFLWRVEQNGGIDLLIDGNLVIDDLMGFGGSPLATLSKFRVAAGNDASTYSFSVDDFLVQQVASNGLIVFSSDRDGHTDIWLMNADGSNPTNLTPDSAEDKWPELSPDGTKIAFSSDRDGDFDIYVMDIDGKNVYRVTDHSGQDFYPSWSPNGTRIVFSSQQLGPEHTIYIANYDGSGTPTMCFNLPGEDAYPSFNIDGTRILFHAMNGSNASSHDIYSADLNGDNLVQHTNGGASTIYHSPRYSPDYTKIVFSAKTYPSTRTDLYVMSANAIPGDPWTRLTNQSINAYASWSLDGSEIVFGSDRDGDFDIYIMEAVDNSPPDGEGDNLRNLTSGSSGWDRMPFVGSTDQPPIPDTTPPEAVTDLLVSDVSPTTVTLSWTAPGDDGNSGIASQYDIRMSESTITEGNWDSATQLVGEPAPNPAGSAEAVQVTQLTEGTTYYFALKTADEVPNWSGLSNIVTATPTATNTPAGPDVQVDLGTVEVTFDNVDTEGVTYTGTTTVNQCGALPSGYQVIGLYTDVSTTAICDPGVIIGIQYTEVPNMDENTLRLFHCEAGQWVDRTTSVDTANNIVYGQVDSFSWFFIGGRWVWVPGATSAPVFPSIYIGIAAALGAAAIAYFARRRLIRQE